MAIVKRTSSKATSKDVQDYLTKEEKTEEILMSGKNCDPMNFSEDFQMTNELYNKNLKYDDRKYYHIKHSFSTEEKNLTPQKALELTEKMCENSNLKGCQYAIIVHKDKEHIHAHIVVNNVRVESNEYGKEGNAYRADNKSLWDLKRESNRLCQENNLTHSIVPLEKEGKDKFTDKEKHLMEQGKDTWKNELKSQIEAESKECVSLEQFKENMIKRYGCEVQERKVKDKETIEFKPNGNRKFCNERRLGADYGRERLAHEFSRNNQREQSRKNGADKTEQRARENGNNRDTNRVQGSPGTGNLNVEQFDIKKRAEARRKIAELQARNRELHGKLGEVSEKVNDLDRRKESATKRLAEIPGEKSELNDSFQRAVTKEHTQDFDRGGRGR